MPDPSKNLALLLCLGVGLAAAHAGGDHAHGGHGHGDHGHAHGGGDHGSSGHHAAPDPHQALARRGGVVLPAGDHRFEVTLSDAGVRVYPMDAAGEPVPVAGGGGTVMLKGRRGRPKRLPLKVVAGAEGAPGYLEAEADLSGVKDGSRTAIFSLTGFGEGALPVNVWTRFQRTHHGVAWDEEPGHDHGGHGDHGHGHGDHGGHDDHGHGPDDHARGAEAHDDHGHGHGHGDHGHAH